MPNIRPFRPNPSSKSCHTTKRPDGRSLNQTWQTLFAYRTTLSAQGYSGGWWACPWDSCPLERRQPSHPFKGPWNATLQAMHIQQMYYMYVLSICYMQQSMSCPNLSPLLRLFAHFSKCNKLLADFDPFKSFEVSIDARQRRRCGMVRVGVGGLGCSVRCAARRNLCQCQPALRAAAAASSANKTNWGRTAPPTNAAATTDAHRKNTH